MEPGGRKLLPRVQPAATDHPADVPVAEPLRNGNRLSDAHDGPSSSPWTSPMHEQTGQKRKRQRLDEPHQPPGSQALPGVRHLLTARSQSFSVDTENSGHARLVRTSIDAYVQDGPFKFLAPHPQLDFPKSVFDDARPLSFASVEPDLMEVFRRTWYLRHYIRLKRMRGESWLDHIFFNDCYGIENTLYNWSSRYEPGTLQYPASWLYKQCLWLFFNRSVQASQTSPAYAQVVEDGIHYLKAIENGLGPTGDRSILLVPLFLLGVSAFYLEQRRQIWDGLDRLDPSFTDEAVIHAAKSLERIWTLMDDGNVGSTWEWERLQVHEYTGSSRDRSLIDLLTDPLALPTQPTRARSPEARDFEPSRFRAAPAQPPAYHQPVPPSAPVESSRSRPEREPYTTPHAPRSPRRKPSVVSIDTFDSSRTDRHSGTPIKQQPDDNQTSKPFAVPPSHQHLTPDAPVQPSTNDAVNALHRKSTKIKSSVPPCPTCGKELKNPSDAQKHQLQHSKPFRCREPGCTRAQGFATENDLQRHRKSVHGASPRIGNKIGYVCAACPEPGDGSSRKWWPRLDNFKAHIRRKHQEREEEELINASASANRPGDADPNYTPASLRWPEDRQHEQELRRATVEGSAGYEQQQAHASSRREHTTTDEYHDDRDDSEARDKEDEDSDESGAHASSEGEKSLAPSEGGKSESSDGMEISPVEPQSR